MFLKWNSNLHADFQEWYRYLNWQVSFLLFCFSCLGKRRNVLIHHPFRQLACQAAICSFIHKNIFSSKYGPGVLLRAWDMLVILIDMALPSCRSYSSGKPDQNKSPNKLIKMGKELDTMHNPFWRAYIYLGHFVKRWVRRISGEQHWQKP